jgi:hypothetical protein
MKLIRFLPHTGVSLALMMLLGRWALVDIMRLTHEPGTIPQHPLYFVRAWCTNEADIGITWFGEPFCFGIDVRLLLLLVVIGFTSTEIWLQRKKRPR